MSTKNRGAALFAALACVATVLPAAATEHCRLKRVGSIPMTWQGLEPRIEGSVNGTPVPMVLDTGAYDVIVGDRLAERLKLSLAHTDFQTMGVSGATRAYTAHIAEISFGSVRWKNVDLPSPATGAGDEVYVGATFLFKRDVEWTGKELVFYDPEHCEDAWLGYWGGDIAAVTLDRAAPGRFQPEVIVTINGQPVRASVASGSAHTVIDIGAARRLGFDPATAPEIHDTGTHGTPTWGARFDTFELGGEVIRRPHIVVKDLWANARRDLNSMEGSRHLDNEPEMFLGADFLKAHRVLFAVSQRRMYFSYLGGEVFNAPTVVGESAAPASADASAPDAARPQRQ